MHPGLTSPANAIFIGLPTVIFSWLIPLLGVAVFSYIIVLRMVPLVKAAPDNRFDRIAQRIGKVLTIWLAQYRQPRYMMAGTIHIVIFAGFLIVSIRSCTMVIIGICENFVMPGFAGALGHMYNDVKDYAATMVLIACGMAAYRRVMVKPARYAVPAIYGKNHTAEALFVLVMISTLMISEGLFEASLAAAHAQSGLQVEHLAPLTMVWFFKKALVPISKEVLQGIHIWAYYTHDAIFFFFLCFLPMGKHFHVVTSLFNVYFMRIDRGNVKPVRYGIKDDDLDDLESFGVKRLEDFTWKHILDFYSCADCGRCSENCPANAVGRPLSPRFISIKGRDLTFASYPLRGKPAANGQPLMGTTYEEDEIWSCSTCGACEQECPLGIEYIDKIIDLRRGMVDEGTVPQSLQKPLRALEKRGNPWGKLEKKRAEWTKALDETVPVKILDGKKQTADTLFFVDSITSFDDRMQAIGRATATVLTKTNADFGILGKKERDSGHEVRRFGEEMLYQDLRDRNSDAILSSGVSRIVTADPHAYNALKNDYSEIPPVEHISQFLARGVRQDVLKFKPIDNGGKVYTYHDPCYLGRHNQVYEDPRVVLDAIPGLKRVEMLRSWDRSFCCGGGGLMLFYEPEEEERMGVLRVKMAAEVGVHVIVTACPFCLVNVEDAIKVAGLDGQMEVVDLVELAAEQLA